MLTKDMFGEFTWDFGQEFFIKTEVGNYVWSDPDYGGDNTIRKVDMSYSEWARGSVGRSKGVHCIESYCGKQVRIIK